MQAQKLLDAASNYLDTDRRIILDKTFDFVKEYYSKQKNQLGFLFWDESFDIAYIVASDIGLGFSAILSALLFRAFENKQIDEKFIRQNYPSQYSKQVISILNGLIEVNKLDNEKVFGLTEVDFSKKQDNLTKRSRKFAQNVNDYLEQQGEYFKNFYIAMGGDIRVILLKLAYHYYKIKNIKSFSEDKKNVICREARYLYSPMAHQLGLYNVKTYLEEIAMKFLDTEVYNHIAKVLAETQANREAYIENFIKPISKDIKNIGIEAKIKGRPKSIHSIWNKMKNQKVGLDKIYDLFAIRIIISNKFENRNDEKAACWNVYSKITDHWMPNTDRLKDWVSSPKASGYESLHTTVIGPEGKWVEVQIRTVRMDEIAEKGSAAHWKYKEIKGETGHVSWLDTLREMLENPEKGETSNSIKSELYSDMLFVYTPAGELKKLNSGATVLDFAYKVHSNLGDHCVGAKIKDKLVGIRHKLTNGDIVELKTATNQKPKEEWLEIVVSNHSRTRIKKSLKEQEKEQVYTGKKILDDTIELFKSKYNKSDFDFDPKKLTRLRKKFSSPRINEFYLSIAKAEIIIDPQLLYNLFIEPADLSYQNVIKRLQDQIISNESKIDSKDYLIIDKNMSGIKYEFAKCCNPIPGDDIFAFVTASTGTKIHKINCTNAHDMISKYPYRVMKAAWKSKIVEEKFKAKLKVICEQKPGIVSQISNNILKQSFVELYDINIKETQRETYEGTIGIYITGKKYLHELINKLVSIQGMISVERIDRI